ncbi:MAG: hypothetical protein WKF78_02780 [Candidatus Limnocylindrales bacterium]
MREPGADLLDTLFICQERQDWYRDHLRAEGATALEFVGSVAVGADVVATARHAGDALGFDLEARRRAATWAQALRDFVGQAEALGILVMRNGVVGNNAHGNWTSGDSAASPWPTRRHRSYSSMAQTRSRPNVHARA